MTYILRLTLKLPILFILLFIGMDTESNAQQVDNLDVTTMQARFAGKTRPLRELVAQPGTNGAKQKYDKSNKPKKLPLNFIGFRRPIPVNPDAVVDTEDPIRQKYLNRFMGRSLEPLHVIEGIGASDSNAGVPDTNGEAGRNHFIQIVNASFFQIFEKNGTPVTDITSANTIWNEIGRSSFSDPVIQYDEAANRWLLTDLASVNVVLYGVSESSDPMGAWYLYEFTTPGFADYPKYGIWPESYILTINEGRGVFPVYAFNREQMLVGAETINVQRLEIPGINGAFPTVTPMDWNSPIPPPTSEVFVVRMNDDAWGNGNTIDQMEIWSIDVDWQDEANTTLAGLDIPVAAFDSDACSINGGFQCIPQPGTSRGIDGIMTIVMNNVAYWNYGSHESAVIAFSVDVGDNVSGIRWMEMRRTLPEGWTLYQEGTFGLDDGGNRVIPSISINGRGDIALAYAVSSEDIFPSLRYTGRTNSDPLGEMTIDEYQFADGAGVLTQTDRFGDYAKMSVDPVDQSFWFTGEYIPSDNSWGSKIVHFQLVKDTFDIAATNLLTPESAAQLSDAEPVTMTISNVGLTDATDVTVGYSFEGMASVIEPINIDTLKVDSAYTHSFMSTVDMSTIGSYELTAFCNYTNDSVPLNDTIKATRHHLPNLDAALSNIINVPREGCDTMILVDVLIDNLGVETIETLQVGYRLDGIDGQVINWKGVLEFNEQIVVQVPIGNLDLGDHVIELFVSSPNGGIDQVIMNDGMTFNYRRKDGIIYTLVLNTDRFPVETSWELRGQEGDILYVGHATEMDIETTIRQEWCLEFMTCYEFVIFDTYGDGLTSVGFPPGSYEILNEKNVVVTSILNANFGYRENNPFCVGEPCDVQATLDITDVEVDVIESGAILITVTSGAGPFMYSIDGGATFQSEPLFNLLEVGTYQVIVKDVNDCTWESEAEIRFIVANNNLTVFTKIDLHPNPVNDGLLTVRISGAKELATHIDYQVVSISGKTLMNGSLPRVDDDYRGIISLHRYPVGVYYIRFIHKEITQLARVIRL